MEPQKIDVSTYYKLEKTVLRIVLLVYVPLLIFGFSLLLLDFPIGLLFFIPSCAGLVGISGLEKRLNREQWLQNKEYYSWMLFQLVIGVLAACTIYFVTFPIIIWTIFLIFDTVRERHRFLD